MTEITISATGFHNGTSEILKRSLFALDRNGLLDTRTNYYLMDVAQEKWDRRYLELARMYSTFSKDPSTGVGAVIVKNNRVVGLGFNGFPEGVSDDSERYLNRDTKYKLIVHAEENALICAGDKTRGGTIYVYPSFGEPPLCTSCCKSVIQHGIKRVVGYRPGMSTAVQERWKEELSWSKIMCDEVGIHITLLEEHA